jgi:predicted Fe-Mo cluster-binding NifX family protein
MFVNDRIHPLTKSHGAIRSFCINLCIAAKIGKEVTVVIAVSCDGLNIAPYFTQTTSYMVYTVERGIIKESKNLPAPGLTEAELFDLLHAIDANTLIVGHIDCNLASHMCHQGIEVIADAEGAALDVAKAYLSKTLTGVLDACFLCDEDDAQEPDNSQPKSI